MYELDYTPDRLDWNEYFVRYKESDEIKYFKEFLHFYEPYLDRKVNRFIKRYELEDYRAEDLKQMFVTVLWEELQAYDSDLPLLQLIKYDVLSAWHDYVRINCGNFTLDNQHQYALLKKIAYLYYRKKERNKPLSQIISEIAEVMDLTEDSIENYLIAVTNFKPKYNADFYGSDEDEDYNSSAVDSAENNLDTERIYFKLSQQERLQNAIAQPTRKITERHCPTQQEGPAVDRVRLRYLPAVSEKQREEINPPSVFAAGLDRGRRTKETEINSK